MLGNHVGRITQVVLKGILIYSSVSDVDYDIRKFLHYCYAYISYDST